MNMDWTSINNSSFLVSLWIIHKDDNGLEWWLLRLTGTVSPPSYHFSTSWFSTLISSPYKFQKTWWTSSHSHINIGWLCNLRFDYSMTFGGFAWLRVVLSAPPMPSPRALIDFTLILKSYLSEHKRSSLKCF